MFHNKFISIFGALALFTQVACADTEAPEPLPVDSVNSYETCVMVGGIIRKTLPAQCVDTLGRVWVNDAQKVKTGCKDECGNGICEEIVCMALGCPCSESKESCPKDCK